ncbi:hypothetical protein [Nonomuraea salmonea]|uniref:hypothetical protein n=1 Tax=Nonomuraea salmonea TaxID=46181 RepID=UPI0031E5CC6A
MDVGAHGVLEVVQVRQRDLAQLPALRGQRAQLQDAQPDAVLAVAVPDERAPSSAVR